MSFLPISILAYALNAGSIVIDKILIRNILPNPLIYTFYINILSLLVIILIPFGLNLNNQTLIMGAISGILFVFAVYTLFKALKLGEASVVGPVVGALNPLFTLLFVTFFLNQILTSSQIMGFSVLLTGALLLTVNIWLKKLRLNKQLFWMVISGFFFSLAYISLKETFLSSNLITGIVVSRVAAGLFVLPLIGFPSFRKQIFVKRNDQFSNKKTLFLLILGQGMAATSGLLISIAISLASPALVNSLFGVQYLVILGVAIILARKHPQLLDESLTKGVLMQKLIGVGVLSLGVYLLSK